MALTELVADFSGNGEGSVVRDGFVVLTLVVDDAEIAEMDAFIALFADFSGDGDGLGVVRDGFVVLALVLVDGCRDCRDWPPSERLLPISRAMAMAWVKCAMAWPYWPWTR